MDETLRQLIHDRVSEQELSGYARRTSRSIRDDGKSQDSRRHDYGAGSPASDAGRDLTMAAFEYIALDERGKQKKGVLEADSVRQIRQMLRDQGLVPLRWTRPASGSANHAAGSSWSAAISISAAPRALDRVLFTRQLSTLIGAGLPIEEALQAIAQQAEKQHVASW